MIHIITGNGAPTTAPTALAQHYVDLTNGTVYQSSGTNSAADWKPSTSVTNEQLQDVIGPMFDNTASAPISSTYDDANNRVVISINQSQINHNLLQNVGTNSHVQIDNHISSIANPHNTTKAQVGLSNVDNTSDLNKPISTATQTALNSKENLITAGTITQYWRGDKSWQTLDKAAVGLGNVDNTSDLNKPISNPTQTALNGKENSFASGATNQYFRGDKSWQILDKTAVGLSNVDNTSDLNKPISTATQTALNSKENSLTAGTITQYLRGDKSWQTLDKTAVGLSNVDNTSDLNKPISNLTQTALNGKENSFASGTVSQYFRGDKTWQTLDKATVGLSNVDNTSDLNKPISTATQTALNGKANTTHTHTSSQITDFTTAVQAIGDIRYSEAGHTHPDATTTTAGFMSPADKSKLDGLVNSVFPKTATVLNNTSNVTYTNITELQINCISGKIYKFRYFLRHTSNATATGITFSISGTASGSIGAKAYMSTSRTATSIPSLNAFAQAMAITGVPSTGPEVSIIEGLFVCTGDGTMYPQFRSELNGSQVQILDNSILEYNEI